MPTYTVVVSGVIPAWFETTVEAPDAETAKRLASEAADKAARMHDNGADNLGPLGVSIDVDGPLVFYPETAEIVG